MFASIELWEICIASATAFGTPLHRLSPRSPGQGSLRLRTRSNPLSMHHQRRKSGHASANTSMTDVRKAVTVAELSAKYSSKASRPAPMTRRTTDKVAQKLGKNPRDREREWDDERWWEEERESFPQFWYVKRSPLLALYYTWFARLLQRSLPASATSNSFLA